MFDKKKDAERILEMTEKILHVVTQAFEKSAYQDERINEALEKIGRALDAVDRRLTPMDDALASLPGAFEEATKGVRDLAAAIADRRELEAEIVKLKKILERKERRRT